jgi:hypothetical protein
MHISLSECKSRLKNICYLFIHKNGLDIIDVISKSVGWEVLVTYCQHKYTEEQNDISRKERELERIFNDMDRRLNDA